MAASTLVRLGSTREAMDLLGWLLRLIEGDGADLDHLAPIYTVDGGALPPEHFDPRLPGYGGSHPVRIGNAAEQQAQTDVFGPIMELIWRLGRAGAPLDEPHWHLVEQLVAAVSLRWREPDQGIWEIRAAPRHHVHERREETLLLHGGETGFVLHRVRDAAQQVGVADHRVQRFRQLGDGECERTRDAEERLLLVRQWIVRCGFTPRRTPGRGCCFGRGGH